MSKMLKGKIISKPSLKTIKVSVLRNYTHPVYGKKIKLSKKYLVHDENEEYSVGEDVTIHSCAPVSKRKKYCVRGKDAS
ncbi:30S ribosomal protein S17 [Candidatus Nesciobacter abundans]|uniref:30S ribosomal protein S17 n=1 Tax=Candidatus Nesciobacter abundans TaxID=2601668 RepID=A0A5C0UGQ3_9PROT|nr:30S ribosomal protein S17 [Candidatus Nesciobacter abundans]QEK38910.1 30S ribosomal protein S17 [Candidatus Nesciobacter abundans]